MGPAAGVSQAGPLRSYVARSAGVCLAGLLLNQAAGQLGGAALARWLPGTSTYGLVALLLQLVNLAALGVGLGLDNALVYDLATGRPQAWRSFVAARNGMLVLAALPAGLCLWLAPWVAALYHQPALVLALRLAGLVLFAQAALNAAVALQTGLRRFATQMRLMVAATALAALARLLVLPAVLDGASVGLVALAGGAGLGAVALAGLRLGHGLRVSGAEARGWVRELPRLFRYGWPLWAGNLLKSFQQTCLVLVAGGVSLAAAGFVANDVALIGWAFIVTWAFRLVAVPLIAGAATAAQRRARTTLCFRLNHLLLFPTVAALALWPRAIVTLVYGARYAGGAGILPLLVLGVYGSSVGRLATDALAASNRTPASLPIMVVSSLPLLLLAPLALAHGIAWLALLYCGAWLASAAYAYALLARLGIGGQPWAAFGEPLLPTAVAAPLALWATHGGGPLAALAAACALVGLSVLVYRRTAEGEEGVAGAKALGTPAAAG